MLQLSQTQPATPAPMPAPVQPARQASPAELALKAALHQDARTHLARMFSPRGYSSRA
jgi:hypothetical protein